LENQFRRNKSLSTELAAILPLIPSKVYAGTIFSDLSTTSGRAEPTLQDSSDTGRTNPSKVLHNLLLWFHHNLDNVATTSSLDNLCPSSGDIEYRKLNRSTSRHIFSDSWRRVARVREAQSMYDLSVGADETGIMKDNQSHSPSRFPPCNSPEQIRKRIQVGSKFSTSNSTWCLHKSNGLS
uniref:Uncharacterized protein n=1 Tax=Echinostoma caproni TaxID=27848 RepID=A0A183BF62_9TREM